MRNDNLVNEVKFFRTNKAELCAVVDLLEVCKACKTYDWVTDKRFSCVLMRFRIIISVLKGFLPRHCSINVSKKIKGDFILSFWQHFFRILIINGFGQ